MSKKVYLVYCQYYCEPTIEIAYFDEDVAKAYADEKNQHLDSNNAYYVDVIEVY